MIGTKVGQYQVLRVLGKGGMGEVYEAVDDKLGRHVAIKILLPRFAEDSEIIARFFNEMCVTFFRREVMTSLR